MEKVTIILQNITNLRFVLDVYKRQAEEQTTEHGMYEPSMKDLNLSEEGEVLS